MSIDLQKAFAADENAVNPDLTPNYLEPPENPGGGLANPENTIPTPQPEQEPTEEPGADAPQELPEDAF